jgi:hypothetical protein
MATEPAGALARLEIDLAAIVANWRDLVARHPWGAVAGVVKADAYGLGATRVAPALHAAGCRHFFTAHLDEAVAIAPLLPGAMVAVLNGMPAGCEADFVAHGVLPVLGTPGEIARWGAQARSLGRALPALLHVDTGMNRLGLDAAQLAALAGSLNCPPPAHRPGSSGRFLSRTRGWRACLSRQARSISSRPQALAGRCFPTLIPTPMRSTLPPVLPPIRPAGTTG